MKILIAFSGWMTGYDGTFSFENPGVLFEDANYGGMRAVMSMNNSLTYCKILFF